MIRKTKYLLTWVLILLLTLGQFTVYAKDYSDIKTSWAKNEIEKWSKKGVLQGSEGMFRPNDNIIRAEMAVILDRIMGYQTRGTNTFTDLDSSWYTEAILKNNAAGIMVGNGMFIRPEDYITRQEAIVMLARALGIEPTSGKTSFNDDNQMASWSKGYIHALNKLGIIHGNPDGSFAPTDPITRAETVKIMDNAIKGFYNKKGSYSEDTQGLVIVNSADVVLEDMTINGDLIISEGVADGEVTLNNVTITGDCYVKGGGENSIIFNSVTVEGGLVVNKHDGKIRIVASGNTKVDVTILESGAILLEKELTGGGFQKVEIPAEVAKESEFVLSGNFSTVEVNAPEVSIDVAKGAKISTLDFSSSAVGSTVSGKGKVTTVKAGANDLAIDVSNSNIDIAKGVEGVTNNGKPADSKTNNDSNGGNTSTTTYVTALSIDQGESITLYPSQISTLTANIEPSSATNKNIVWSTTSAAITLDSHTGEVTVADSVTSAVVTITATALGGTNVKDTIVVNIIPDQLHSIIQPSDITVVNGTTMAAIDFPQAVEIVLDSERTLNVDISRTNWTTAQGITYEPTVPGSYRFVSTLDLPDEITNGNDIPLNLIVNVVVEEAKYTITFVTEKGANNVMPQEVIEGELAIEPSRPYLYGYTFSYWYTNDENNWYDFNTEVTSDLTLTAKWMKYDNVYPEYRDTRFAEGYPKMVVNSDNTIDLKIKLASSEPARIYTILNSINAFSPCDVDSVMHGHAGIGSVIYANYSEWIDINDTKEHTLKTYQSVDDVWADDYIYSAFVIKQGNTISENPTVLTMAQDIVATLSTYAPSVYSVLVNQARNKIFIYVDNIDVNQSNAEPSEFMVTGLEGVEVTSVDISEVNKSYYDSNDRIELSVTGLDQHEDLSNLKINYTGTGIHDGSENKEALILNEHNNYSFIYEIPQFTNIVYSKNKDFIDVEMDGSFYGLQHSISVTYGPNRENAVNCDLMSTTTTKYHNFTKSSESFIITNPPIGDGEFFVEITGDTMADDTVTITDDEKTNKIEFEFEPVIISSVSYYSPDELLLITFDGMRLDNSIYGCNFTISVNGVEALIHGRSGSHWSNDEDTIIFQRIGIDINQGDTVKIKYVPQHPDDGIEDEAGDYMMPTDWIPVTIINE